MRIGILTLPLHTNYGGILQAYALQTVLERMGHEVIEIEKKQKGKDCLGNLAFQLVPRLFNRIILKSDIQLCPELFKLKFEPVIRRHTNGFIGRYLHVKSGLSYEEVVGSCCLDYLVVGSDQVWRPLYVENVEDYFIGFSPEMTTKRISYAASFGVDKWEFSDEQTGRCSALAKRFTAISVRERSGVDFCNKYLGVKAVQVLDPTLLLEQADYVRLLDMTNKEGMAGNLFCYILDKTARKKSMIDDFARMSGLTPFYTKAKKPATLKNCIRNIGDCVIPGVTDWVKSFVNADLVITDSFHGCVFSIIFNKPFWVFVNSDRGAARFNSLLSIFNLSDRILSEDTDLDHFEWRKSIDWEFVNKQREIHKANSISFLKTHLI